jgi:hypothetical protein
VLEGVSSRAALDVSVTAEGFRGWSRSLSPPLPAEILVSLERSARVTGCLVDAEGLPLGGGTVQVTGRNRVYDEPIAADGTFTLELDPGVAVDLHIRSPAAFEVHRHVPALAAGEVHALGDVTASTGMVVVGQLWRAETAEPVTGARVWSVRSGGPGGAIAAWALGNVVETRSDGDGRFRLSGLVHGPGSLRLEAEGLAPREVPVRPPEASSDTGVEVDVGDLLLSPGATVHVVGDSEWSGTARVDWQGRWLEMDMIRASYGGGEAWLEHVPAGEAVVTVLDGPRLLCELHIEVPTNGTLDVDCADGELRVRGLVTVGGEPAGPGKLSWLSPTGGDTLVMNRRTASGATEAQIFGAGRPQVDVAVGPDGWFASDALAPGEWDVFWHPAGGGGGRHREVKLPEEGDVELELAFSPHSLGGWVVDEEGRSVAEARVVDLDGRAATRTGADGTFLLLDLEPGPRRLRALAGERRSAVVTAVVPVDGRAEPITLVLDREGDESVRIAVRIGDAPAASAFVFVELEGQGIRILTADGSGVARAGLLPPIPLRLRAAAISGPHVALGEWVSTEEAMSEGLVLVGGEGGGLEILSSEINAAVDIVGPGGWNLSALFARLGTVLRVSADNSLVIHGLPVGSYTIAAGDSRRAIRIERGRLERTEID